jgi:lipopolysaccharide transport system ATP-binding protein
VVSIDLRNASIEFQMHNSTSRSLTSRALNLATGGRLDSAARGQVRVSAISNLSIAIKEGDRVGLIGHNGAGKSTLLRMLNGIYAPTSGSLNITGSVSSLVDISLGINQEATGRENIFLRGLLLGYSKGQMLKHFDEIVDFAELGDFINLPVRSYSTGMLLRLAFAVSTTVKPDILIMDEWLSVGDEGFRARAEARLHELVENTKILVLASHSKELLSQVCNRIIWLEHGELKLDGSPEEVLPKYFL